MEYVEVHTQAELDEALKKKGVVPVCKGDGRFVLRGNAHAELWENAHAVLRGNAHAVLRENAHAVLRGNAHADAAGSSQVHLFSGSVKATDLVAITRLNPKAKVTGGVVIDVPPIKTAEDWLGYYGVTAKRGIVTLFKALDDDYSTDNGRRTGVAYTPGSKPEAPDWDGGVAECGGGLHFCPSVGLALGFNAGATRFVACPVRVKDIVVHENPQHPSKIKAQKVCGPVYEVDRRGEKVEA